MRKDFDRCKGLFTIRSIEVFPLFQRAIYCFLNLGKIGDFVEAIGPIVGGVVSERFV
jgi:hypothetical protein